MKDQMTIVERREKVKFQKTKGHQIYKTSDGIRVPGVDVLVHGDGNLHMRQDLFRSF